VSEDKGITWQKAKGLCSDKSIPFDSSWQNSERVYAGMDISFNSFESHNGTFYAAGSAGVYKSMDNGQNWIYIGGQEVVSLATDKKYLYAGTAFKGIWRISI